MSIEKKKKIAEEMILKILQNLEEESKKQSIFIDSIDIIHNDDDGMDRLFDVKINMSTWT